MLLPNSFKARSIFALHLFPRCKETRAYMTDSKHEAKRAVEKLGVLPFLGELQCNPKLQHSACLLSFLAEVWQWKRYSICVAFGSHHLTSAGLKFSTEALCGRQEGS